MCVVSMIGDHFGDMWKNQPFIVPAVDPNGQAKIDFSLISRAEFEALKKEVEILKELLIKAIAYDKANGEPHCEKPEKVKLLKDIAKALGVELNGI
jgi:hypothetical protein